MGSTLTLAFSAQRYCFFQRAGTDFALPLPVASRVVSAQPLTRVPFAPPDLCGVFLDGRDVVPVVLLDRWLGVEAGANAAAWLLIEDGDLRLAGVVDRVLGIASVGDHDVKRAVAHPLASGIVVHEGRTVVLLDAQRLVASITGSLLAALPQAAGAS